MIYLENNVFEEALERIRFLYDNFGDIIVSMSGGKDSTVLFNLAMIVAKEKGRLPLKVFWLDQECEWQATVDYMTKIMERPDVKPLWMQFPFDFTNSLSPQKNFIHLWDPAEKENWIHPQHELSIKENPTKYNRFHDLVNWLPNEFADSDETAALVGMKCSESLGRRITITSGKTICKGVTWCRKPNGKTRVFWPIYDFKDSDIWTAIAKNHWDYNKIYDYQYQMGVAPARMRVSALIHETAWASIENLQEFEPRTYERFVRRVNGVSTYNHAFDMGDPTPHKLPFAFSSWKEYRDYLLIHIVKPEYWDMFKKRWKGQDTETWYKVHVKECMIEDIDGTLNANFKRKDGLEKAKEDGRYKKRDTAQFERFLKGEEKLNDKRPAG